MFRYNTTEYEILLTFEFHCSRHYTLTLVQFSRRLRCIEAPISTLIGAGKIIGQPDSLHGSQSQSIRLLEIFNTLDQP
jgi:hypothetical protein